MLGSAIKVSAGHFNQNQMRITTLTARALRTHDASLGRVILNSDTMQTAEGRLIESDDDGALSFVTAIFGADDRNAMKD